MTEVNVESPPIKKTRIKLIQLNWLHMHYTSHAIDDNRSW